MTTSGNNVNEDFEDIQESIDDLVHPTATKKIGEMDVDEDGNYDFTGQNKTAAAVIEEQKKDITYEKPSREINFDDISDENLSKLPLNIEIDTLQKAAKYFLHEFRTNLTIRDPHSKKFIKKNVPIYKDIIRLFSQKEIKIVDINYNHFTSWCDKYFENMMNICKEHSFEYPVVDLHKLNAVELNELYIYMYSKKLQEYLDKDKVELFQKIMKEAVLSLYVELYDNELSLDLQKTKEPEETRSFLNTHIGVKNFPNERDIYTIKPEFLNKAIVVKGDLLTFDDKPRVQIIKTMWRCDNCKNKFSVWGSNKPRKCSICNESSFLEDTQEYENISYIYIKIQQHTNSHDVQIGTTELMVKIEGSHLIQNFYKKMKQGANLKITGIVKLSTEKINKNNLDERLLQLHAITLEIEGENTTVQYNDKLLDIIANKVKASNMEAHYEKLKRSICPHLYGRQSLKETVLLMCVGAVPRVDRISKHRIRGDINALFCGDPGTGKSELGLFIEKILPFSIRTIGGKSTTTKAALTTSSDQINGIRIVTRGVLPRCDLKGVAIVDELDKRDQEDMQILSIPMDDNQIIPTHKSGFHHNVHARCPVLLIGNATKKHGKWDITKTIGEQTNYAVWLVSRVDLVFVVIDEGDIQEKKKMVEHMAKSRSGMVAETDYVKNYKNKTYSDISIEKIEQDLENNKFDGVYDTEYLRHEVHYLKQNFKPTIKPGSDVEALLKKEYLRFSQMKILNNDDEDGDGPYTQAIMDARAYNGLERISMAVARCMRHHTVTIDDMHKALNLMMASLTSMMPRQKSNSDKLNDPNTFVYKQMNKLINSGSGIKKILDANNAGWLHKRDQAIKKYRAKLHRFNGYLFKRGFDDCKECHARGYVSLEANGMTETCSTCKGNKVFNKKFTWYDFEADIINSKIMAKHMIKPWFDIYKKYDIIKNVGGSAHILGLTTIDSVIMSDFVDNLAIQLADEEINAEKERIENGDVGFGHPSSLQQQQQQGGSINENENK